jgi:predicted dienelactone hydrolase
MLTACAPPLPLGDPDAPGPYPVGITTFTLPADGDRAATEIEVWYPAAEVGPDTTYDALGVPLPAHGARDVAPDARAPRRLVAFSHGLGGLRQQNYTMAERLASFGYIVASADHPGTTTTELLSAAGNLKGPLLARPATVIAMVDAVQAGAAGDVRPRGEDYALVGHSLGAVTAMFVAGGRIDIDAFQATCAADPHPGACDLIGPLDATPEEIAALPAPDPRVTATVLQNPSGQFAFAPESLAAIPHALVMGGENDDPTGTAEPTYALLDADASLVVYDRGGHNAATDICDIPVANLIAPDCVGTAGGYADPLEVRARTVVHTLAWLGVYDAQEEGFSPWLGQGEGFTWTD